MKKNIAAVNHGICTSDAVDGLSGACVVKPSCTFISVTMFGGLPLLSAQG